MRFDVARFASIAPMRWKNGFGTTTQLAIHPPGATPEDFDWRVSIAQLDAAAPFSVFDGVERCLAVLQGELRLEGWAESVLLTPESAPFRFSGSIPVNGVPVRGPVLDLNVMYRTTHWRATVRRVLLPATATIALAKHHSICSLAPVALFVGGESVQLDTYDLLTARAPLTVSVDSGAPLQAYLIEFIKVAVG